MKLLVLGWDAASLRHLRHFDLEFWDSLDFSGTLLPEELFHGTYVSSGNAWTTITTGTSFDEHRIFGFVHGPWVGHPLAGPIKWMINRPLIPRLGRRLMLGFVLGNLATEGGRGATPQSTDVPYKRVWEYLPGDALVFGLPVTYPAWSTNGILVAGVPAPSPSEATHSLTYPRGIQQEVFDNDFTGYHVDMTSPIHDETVSQEEFCEAHITKTEQVAGRFLDVHTRHEREFDFEFGFLMLRSIDDVLHATTDPDLVERIYRKTDAVSRRIVDEIDPDDVLVISDHGMRKVSSLRKEKHTKMDHDTTQGVWGSTHRFDIERQIEVTPAISDYFGIDDWTPERKDSYDVIEDRIDEGSVKSRLEDLGYM